MVEMVLGISHCHRCHGILIHLSYVYGTALLAGWHGAGRKARQVLSIWSLPYIMPGASTSSIVIRAVSWFINHIYFIIRLYTHRSYVLGVI